MYKILLFSSVRKDLETLKVVLPSWFALKKNNFEVTFAFFDDNDSKLSSEYLHSYRFNENVEILDFKINIEDNYKGNHKWNLTQIDRISHIKNEAIQYALINNYDYLFLVDADLVLNPNTLSHLVSLKKHFVFEVFWTLFFNESFHKPNAWDYHSWAYYNEETIIKLSKKGTYEVGGGGACTLLSKEILKKGLNFNRLESLNFNGEDRHFCTRAQALGYSVYVDTNYPAYHIFNTLQVEEANNWFINGAKPVFFDNWLTGSWRDKVINSYKKETSFLSKLKKFQYEVRRAIIKSYKSHFKST